MQVLLVGIGGFVGSVLRYLLHTWVQERFSAAPVGTLAVNVAGCCLIGFVVGLAEARGSLSRETQLLLIVGFCGGFTTYSTFGFETLNLLSSRQAGLALANVAAQLVLGIGAVWLGMVSARTFGGST